jgi:uncharacterized protein
MINNQFSLILLPTNECNVACDYCFEDKTAGFITHDQLSLTIKPEWFERAHELISEAASRRRKKIDHSLQSNMIRYSAKWNKRGLCAASPFCKHVVVRLKGE